jgi:hypothetical protein
MGQTFRNERQTWRRTKKKPARAPAEWFGNVDGPTEPERDSIVPQTFSFHQLNSGDIGPLFIVFPAFSDPFSRNYQ